MMIYLLDSIHNLLIIIERNCDGDNKNSEKI